MSLVKLQLDNLGEFPTVSTIISSSRANGFSTVWNRCEIRALEECLSSLQALKPCFILCKKIKNKNDENRWQFEQNTPSFCVTKNLCSDSITGLVNSWCVATSRWLAIVSFLNLFNWTYNRIWDSYPHFNSHSKLLKAARLCSFSYIKWTSYVHTDLLLFLLFALSHASSLQTPALS